MPPWGSEGNGDERILGSTFREKPFKDKNDGWSETSPCFFVAVSIQLLSGKESFLLALFLCVCGSKLLSDYDFALLRNIISPEPGSRSTNDE